MTGATSDVTNINEFSELSDAGPTEKHGMIQIILHMQ